MMIVLEQLRVDYVIRTDPPPASGASSNNAPVVAIDASKKAQTVGDKDGQPSSEKTTPQPINKIKKI